MLIIGLTDKLGSHPSSPRTELEMESRAWENREGFTAPTCVHMDAHTLCFHTETHLQEKLLPGPSARMHHPAPALGLGPTLPPPGTSDHHLFLECLSENFAGQGDDPGKVREQKI